MPCGSWLEAAVIAVCTSWAAASMLRVRSNCSVICVLPMALVEVIESSPAMVVNCFSSGVATAEAMVSGLAPGRLAETVMVGKSTLGRSLTARSRYATKPNSRMASMIRLVITGRRMKSSATLIAIPEIPSEAVLDADFHPGHQAHLPVGHHGLTRLHIVRGEH